MAHQIIVKKRFTNKIVKVLHYLESQWGKTVANRFLKELDKRLDTLSQQPFIGVPANEPKTVRSILITKHNRLYYRIKGKTIEIVNMYDTRMNPKNNPFNKK
jgi:plasmid stabilization system protein ParE